MKIKKWARAAINFYDSIIEKMAWVGYISIVFIALLVFVDVGGRYLFNRPIQGSIELVEVTMALTAGSAIMYATLKRVHVALDFLLNRFSRHVQIILQSVFSFLGFATWLLVAYQVYQYGLTMMNTTQVTSVLRISLTPFLLVMGVAAFLCSLILLIQTFDRTDTKDSALEEGTKV